MATFNNYEHQQHSLYLLLPLVCLAIISFALDPRMPHNISEPLRLNFLSLTRIVIPGVFAVNAALLIPATSRSLQLLTVIISYAGLLGITFKYMPQFLYGPTACVLSALTSTIAHLPSGSPGTPRSLLHLPARLATAFAIPAICYIIMLTVTSHLKNFISLILTSTFVTSLYASVIIPTYLFMQTMGFNQIFNSMEILLHDEAHINCIANVIMLTNMVSLPALIMARSFFVTSQKRIFLCFLGFITLLTSQIGSCISLELAMLLFFYPGSYMTLLGCSVFMYMCAFSMDFGHFTNFFWLYDPDLIMNTQDLLSLPASDYICVGLALVLPVLAVCIFITLGHKLKTRYKPKIRASLNGYSIKPDSQADLLVLGLLRALGGISNLRQVRSWSNKVLIEVEDTARVSEQVLKTVCLRKAKFDRRRNLYVCDLGNNSPVVEKRLYNLLDDNRDDEDRLQNHPAFDLPGFIRRTDQSSN